MDWMQRFKELLEMRREAKDANEKALIDKAIEKLIDSMPNGGMPAAPSYPSPWWVSKPETVPYYTSPITCCAGTRQKGE